MSNKTKFLELTHFHPGEDGVPAKFCINVLSIERVERADETGSVLWFGEHRSIEVLESYDDIRAQLGVGV
jgi:hypothetical protein